MPHRQCNYISKLALTLIAVGGAALPARAQDLTALSLDQLMNLDVVTASRFTQKVSEAPSSVSVVTADDIRIFGYRTVADVLRSLRGVYVSDDRNYSYIGTRGSGRPGDYNSRVLVLIDGQRLNDNVYSQGSVGNEFPIDLDLIERIEYVPGPGSAVYGSNAFFGVLNIITRKARSLDGVTTTLVAGSQDTAGARLTASRRFSNGGDLLISLSGQNSRGKDRYFPEYDSADSNRGVAVGLDYERSQRFFAKYTFEELTLEAYFGSRTKGIPTAAFGQQFNDPRSQSVDRYAAATAGFQHDLSATLSLNAALNVSQYVYKGDYAYGTDAASLNRDASASTTVAGEIRLLDKSIKNHRLAYGIEVFDDTQRRLQNYNVDPYLSVLDVSRPRRGYALYLQDEIRLADTLLLNAGVRHDHDSEGVSVNNPRLGLIYQVTPDLTTKLLYGSAFRSPNAFESYYVTDVSRYKSGPALHPERIKTYEFVTEYFPRRDFRSSVSLFRYKLANLISLAADPADQLLYYANAGSASARGVELETELLPADGSRFKGSASFQFARNDQTGERLTNSPTQLLKLNYSRPVWQGDARAALEVQYTGRRTTVVGGAVGGFAVTNFTLSGIRFGQNVELSASIYNLLNKNFADPPSDEHFDNSVPVRFLQGIRQDGRVGRLTLSYRF
jgi:outer membrane receptor protein involved in Fe transport